MDKTGMPKAKASTQCQVVKGLFNQRRRWARGRVERLLSLGRLIGLLVYAQRLGSLLQHHIFSHQV
ncbi:hypothetical protein [Photobacterium kishitanii]|uniref:hypothetical protein n=1 Tax=Photobacterium kishitanii TaxID=318456 RepID=UPI002739265C|nr:hypothetical protein [Photobacterium kishitanii]